MTVMLSLKFLGLALRTLMISDSNETAMHNANETSILSRENLSKRHSIFACACACVCVRVCECVCVRLCVGASGTFYLMHVLTQYIKQNKKVLVSLCGGTQTQDLRQSS